MCCLPDFFDNGLYLLDTGYNGGDCTGLNPFLHPLPLGDGWFVARLLYLKFEMDSPVTSVDVWFSLSRPSPAVPVSRFASIQAVQEPQDSPLDLAFKWTLLSHWNLAQREVTGWHSTRVSLALVIPT